MNVPLAIVVRGTSTNFSINQTEKQFEPLKNALVVCGSPAKRLHTTDPNANIKKGGAPSIAIQTDY